jgi:predicted nucleotidyltransferase
MVEQAIVENVKRYLASLPRFGIHASRAVLYGSFARGEDNADSDIDLVVIAPEFDGRRDISLVKALWRATVADDRIEPIPCGEREWESGDGRPIIEIARREGLVIAPDVECGTRATTRMVAMAQIEELGHRIGEEFGAERVILFGSYARGAANPDSDVDILVIGPFEGRSVDRSVEIRMKLRPGFPMDLLVRTPEKVRERIEMGDSFMREILDQGKVLYEADHR